MANTWVSELGIAIGPMSAKGRHLGVKPPVMCISVKACRLLGDGGACVCLGPAGGAVKCT